MSRSRVRIVAVNKSNQLGVNRFINHNDMYDRLVNNGKDGTPATTRAYRHACSAWLGLPREERRNIERYVSRVRNCYPER